MRSTRGEPDARRSQRTVILAIDTATATAVVALGTRDGELRAQRTWRAGYRHGEELLVQVDDLLRDQETSLDGLAAVVVGTGPGAFTGLRVGLATAKGLAHALQCPIAAVSTGRALLAAVVNAGAGAGRLALLLPAGPSDRTLVDADGARLLPGGHEPLLEPGTMLVAVDLDGRAPADAVARGRRAVDGLAASLIALGARRLAEGGDDLAGVVPEYVTLPRGIREEAGEVTWSHDRR